MTFDRRHLPHLLKGMRIPHSKVQTLTASQNLERARAPTQGYRPASTRAAELRLYHQVSCVSQWQIESCSLSSLDCLEYDTASEFSRWQQSRFASAPSLSTTQVAAYPNSRLETLWRQLATHRALTCDLESLQIVPQAVVDNRLELSIRRRCLDEYANRTSLTLRTPLGPCSPPRTEEGSIFSPPI